MPVTLSPGQRFPQMVLPALGGKEISLGAGGAQLIVVYRGQHCPKCRDYLGTLEALRADFAVAGINVIAVSADSKTQAQAFVSGIGYDGAVCYGITVAQMHALGLYLSAPRTPPETDHVFPEPGLFFVDDEGVLSLVDVSNAPFMRPDLANVLDGIKMTREKGFPIRGRHGL